jgi:uncharacterized SAM-binding protein YcdF (DUF218 family)
MFFILSKFLLFLIKPLIWILALLLFAILTKNQKRRKKLLVVSLGLLFLLSNNFLVNELFLLYETPADKNLENKYEVGLVLGGFSKMDTSLGRTIFFESNDRLMQAIKEFKTGRVNKLMISSGNAQIFENDLKEADAVKMYLNSIGIDDSKLIIENQSRNTFENIKFSKHILDSIGGQYPVLIFSSAWHLPRVRIFTEHTMNSDFYPTNYISDKKRDFSPSNLLVPSASALSHFELLMKEWVGYIFYKLKK